MPKFDEHALEMSIMRLFEEQGYTYVSGNSISRPLGEVIIENDLREFLRNRYNNDGITESDENYNSYRWSWIHWLSYHN